LVWVGVLGQLAALRAKLQAAHETAARDKAQWGKEKAQLQESLGSARDTAKELRETLRETRAKHAKAREAAAAAAEVGGGGGERESVWPMPACWLRAVPTERVSPPPSSGLVALGSRPRRRRQRTRGRPSLSWRWRAFGSG
jgi:hypothetical protein